MQCFFAALNINIFLSFCTENCEGSFDAHKHEE